MKRISAFIIACFMLFSLASCNKNEAPVDINDTSITEVTAPTENSTPASDNEKVEEPKEEKKNYPDNILANPLGQGGYLFNNQNVRKESIQSITFLDTLADMPDDAWDASRDLDMSVMAWINDNNDLYVAGEGGVTASNCKGLFLNCRNATSINFNGCFYTDLCDRITEMFMYCDKLETLDLSGWNTSNMKYLNAAFRDCSNLKSINLSGWDTSNVETMGMMFERCMNLESIDVSHFDTSKVIDFSNMFTSCRKLTSVDLSGWDTSSAKSMEEMFKECKIMSSIGDLKIPEGCITTDMFKYSPLE